MASIDIQIKAIVDKAVSELKKVSGSVKDVGNAGKQGNSGLDFFNKGLAAIGVGAVSVVAAIGAFVKALKFAIDEASRAQQVNAQLEQVIRSTGEAAGISADEINDMADSLSKMSGMDEDVIKKGAAVLLTFTSIGKDVFPAATEAAMNLSAAMGQDLQSSIVQIGKALNDPSTGITALSRVGVSFSEAQKEIIQSLQNSGDVAGAQKIILAELNKEFGGQASKNILTYAGSLDAVKNSVGNLGETIGSALLGNLTEVNLIYADAVSQLNSLISAIVLTKQMTGGLSEAEQRAYIDFKKTSAAVDESAKGYLAAFYEAKKLKEEQELQAGITDIGTEANQRLAESLGNLGVNTDLLNLKLGETAAIEEDVAARTENAAQKWGEYNDRMGGVASAQERLADATNNSADAQRNLDSAVSDFNEKTASGLQGTLDKLLGDNKRYHEGLRVIDEQTGTNLLGQEEYNDAMEKAATEYANSGNVEAFAEAIKKIKENYEGQDEKIKAATEEMKKYNAELDKAREDVTTNIYQVYHQGNPPPKPGLGGSIVNPGGGGGEFEANGGPVSYGKPYIVGEKGPEMFVPSTSGTIVPNDKIAAGGGGAIVNVYANVGSGIDVEDLAYRIAEVIQRS